MPFFTSACGTAKSGSADQVRTKPWAEVEQSDKTDNGTYDIAKQIGTITDKRLPEVSGITAGRVNPGVWWVHNDSGDKANIYAINSSGKLLATFSVPGAKNVDWEDIASGPGRDGRPALYLADIGDNKAKRDEAVIYRVPEPLLKKGARSGTTETAEAFPFRYPDGKHNAEALFVDPKSGRLYIVTKLQRAGCKVYRFPHPLTTGKQVTLEVVKGSAVNEISNLLLVTGASAAPDGSRVIIRTYFNALELRRARGGAFETIFNATPVLVNIPLERQGEAIAYTTDSKSIVTTGEKVPAPIYQMTRH